MVSQNVVPEEKDKKRAPQRCHLSAILQMHERTIEANLQRYYLLDGILFEEGRDNARISKRAIEVLPLPSALQLFRVRCLVHSGIINEQSY